MKLHLPLSTKEKYRFLLLSDPRLDTLNDPEVLKTAREAGEAAGLVLPSEPIYVTMRPLSFEERAVIQTNVAIAARNNPEEFNWVEKALPYIRKAVVKVEQGDQSFPLESLYKAFEDEGFAIHLIIHELQDRAMGVVKLGKAGS